MESDSAYSSNAFTVEHCKKVFGKVSPREKFFIVASESLLCILSEV